MKGVTGLAAFAVAQCACWPASAQPSCPFKAFGLDGGKVYYLDGAKPTRLTNASILEARTRTWIELYYVVKSDRERKGALVIKTARVGPVLADDEPASNRVRLKRNEASQKCDRGKERFTGEVTTGAYAEYHDYGRESGEHLSRSENGVTAHDKMKRFHTSYETVGGCRETDTKNQPNGRYEARNNRSQFSFNTRIVDWGYESPAYYVVAEPIRRGLSLVFPPAFAQTELRELKVEIKPYATAGGHACIPLRVEVRGRAQILRVNDLEAVRTYGDRIEFRLGD